MKFAYARRPYFGDPDFVNDTKVGWRRNTIDGTFLSALRYSFVYFIVLSWEEVSLV
jgi:hypothetical protein